MKYPWLAWYPGEYISKTRNLSMAQHGAYMLLLWEYYINGPILANATGLLNVCCGRTDADRNDIHFVLARFFDLEDGFYRHRRADEEINKRLSISDKRKLVGSKGGIANATRLLKQKGRQSQSQSQSKEESKSLVPRRDKTGTRLPEGFKVTDAIRSFAAKEGLPDPDLHVAQFIDYWCAIPGQRGMKLDWDATFRNWLRRVTEFKAGGGNGKNGSGGRNPEPRRNTQVDRFTNNLAAVAAVGGRSNRNASQPRLPGVANPSAPDSTGQAARHGASDSAVLGREAKELPGRTDLRGVETGPILPIPVR